MQVMFLINLYARTVNHYIAVLAPLMVAAVSLQGVRGLSSPCSQCTP